jgi:hypothetical protein
VRDGSEKFLVRVDARAAALEDHRLRLGSLHDPNNRQPDRSFVRSLLSRGLDLWLVDWGQPTRVERWLTIDDYVDDYIHAAVERVCREGR